MSEPNRRETILCLNTGSSSLKFALYEFEGDREQLRGSGAVEGIEGSSSGRLWLHAGESRFGRPLACTNHEAALTAAFSALDEAELARPTCIAHRVVHGGPRHVAPVPLDAALVTELRALIPLAPLHLPAAIAGIEAARQHAPGVPQIAAFDTAFHARMPALARRFALPDELDAQGVHRYGFHGLSFEYVLSVLGTPPPERVIVAHLGNGSSLAAVRDGVSIDTTMGLTPTGGVAMGTRSGDLDPGVLIYLARHGYSADALEKLLNRESGLLALGGTADMAELLNRRSSDSRAALAVDIFCYSVRKAIGGLAFALGGLDVLVFTGGIGEHAAFVREQICRDLEPFGIQLDPHKNQADAREIQATTSRIAVQVIRTDEDLMLARHALHFLLKF
ncbi:MAG TPA: acetate/propionate family kinase [Polyangiaceae bacterium]|jgi:acetate kinase